MKKTFIFYSDWIDYTEQMSLEEKGLFLQTILNFQSGQDLGDIGPIKFVWSRIKKQLTDDNKKRELEIEKRKKAGSMGGKAKSSKGKQVLASASKGKQILADNVNDNVNVNDNDIYTPLPPTGEGKEKINYQERIDKRNEASEKMRQFLYQKTKDKDVLGLPKANVLTDNIKTSIKNLIKEGLHFELLRVALNNYSAEIAKRDKENGYYNHRFTLSEFLSQKNAMRKFVNG